MIFTDNYKLFLDLFKYIYLPSSDRVLRLEFSTKSITALGPTMKKKTLKTS